MQETNLSALDLNLLVVLQALLETRSTTLAAHKLSLSQPATSHALGRLREVFDDPLLVRAGRALAPTPLAESLVPRVERALAAVRETFAASSRFEPGSSTRTFELGAGDYAASVLLPRLVQDLGKAAPGVDLFIKPAREHELESLSGDVELLLMPIYGEPQGPLRAELLFSERFVCVVRKDHPVTRTGLTLDAFCALGHVLIAPRGTTRRGAVDDALAALGRSRRVAVAVPHFSVAPLVVARSEHVLTLAERSARALGPELGLTVLEPPLSVPGFEMGMHWHVRHEADPGHQFMREALRRAARPLARRRAR